MPVEIRGEHLRVRVKNPVRGAEYRTQDVGEGGHSQRIAMYNPATGKWSTQSWLFPVKDVKERRANIMEMLSKLGVQREALALAGEY